MDGTVNLQLWDYYGTSCQLFKFNKIGNISKSADEKNITIDNIQIDTNVQVYPNPSKGGEFNIYFASQSDENYSLTIYSIDGKPLYETKNLKSNTNQFIRTKLARGIYLAMISQNATKITKKIVIE
ncbi:hypothetical protein FLAT13_03674 [Flavobacterium salmonis]|uniref:Secretion system C-terminal sorting domain-containing protein n=2 Tax=Flavobacterium salmonis TaxID=2654844 RepID=A0A6V6Z5W6_9FLAO|nr:hypothetical protein FLAT13_03674 [Flavobacterium salmonis]